MRSKIVALPSLLACRSALGSVRPRCLAQRAPLPSVNQKLGCQFWGGARNNPRTWAKANFKIAQTTISVSPKRQQQNNAFQFPGNRRKQLCLVSLKAISKTWCLSASCKHNQQKELMVRFGFPFSAARRVERQKAERSRFASCKAPVVKEHQRLFVIGV